jgi:DNA-binding transcriptional ArsR family regulator
MIAESAAGQPDLTAFVDAPMAEIVPALQAAVRDAGPPSLEQAGALIRDRTLDLLREGSRGQILDEGLALDRFLSSPEGRALARNAPEVFGAWSGLAALLAEAARRSDRPAVESILRSHKGYGQTILEILAARGAPVSRSEIRERLGLSESHLSHVLRDLDEADLIARVREGRDILLDLGPIGRDVVEGAVLPAWLTFIVQLLGDWRRGGRAKARDAKAIEAELMARGAPSSLAARRLAEALNSPPAVVQAASITTKRVGRAAPPTPRPGAPAISGRRPDREERPLRHRPPLLAAIARKRGSRKASASRAAAARRRSR